ncbi:hypothetical protein GC169_09995 [bacterium]|nr:hypothetical protein [bacterium]
MKRILAACVAGFALASGPAFAQASGGFSPPRTPDGRPDFQGVWTNASLTRLERVPEFKDLVLTPEQAAGWEASAASVAAGDNAPTDPSEGAPEAGKDPEGYNFFWIDPGTRVGKVNGEYRSSWIVDPPNGRVPYTQAGRAAMMKTVSTYNSYDNPEERIPIERCLFGFASTAGPPMLNALYNNHHQFIQTADAMAINIEMIHDTRIIRIEGEHHPLQPRQYFGSSVGRWDGDTFVAETVGFRPAEAVRVDFGFFAYFSPDAKVTERFTLVGEDEMLYRFTVEDPVAYTQPWTGELTFRRSPDRIYEYACHEGNYSVPNILGGARIMEKEGRKAAVTAPRSRIDRN